MKLKYCNKRSGNGIFSFAIFIILIIVSCTLNIRKAIMPYCVSDEIGYWTAAAWFNNFDWSPLMSHSQYYGWGYGILLSLIFRISDPILRFRLAILINTLLLIAVFIFLCKICDLLFKDSEKVNIYIAGTATCYSYNIIFAHTSMCEVFLLFLFVVSVYALLKYLDNPTLINFCILGISILFQFATHLRTISCIIAFILTDIFMLCIKKIKLKEFMLLLFWTIISIILVYYVKDLLVQSEYTSDYVRERLTGNEGIGSHLSVFRLVFSSEFWYELIYSLTGKLFYLVCSTAFTIIGALIYIVNDIKQFFINIHSKSVYVEDKYITVKIYVCLCFLGSLAVDVISTMGPDRIDALLYGRYIENTLPIMICIGIYWMLKKCNNRKIFWALILVGLLGKAVMMYLLRSEIITSIALNIGWFSGWLTQDRMNDYYYYSIYPVFIFSGLMAIFIVIMRKNAKAACLLLAICWIISAENGWLNVITPQLDRMEKVIEASHELKQLDEPYYCIIPEGLGTDTEEFVDVSWLQYQLGTYTLYEIVAADIEKKAEDSLHIIISPLNKNYNYYTNIGTIIWSNSRFSIVEYKKVGNYNE